MRKLFMRFCVVLLCFRGKTLQNVTAHFIAYQKSILFVTYCNLIRYKVQQTSMLHFILCVTT